MLVSLDWFCKWYLNNCDGDWEHTYGFNFESIDNPGWSLKIDLADTTFQDALCPLTKIKRSNEDWYEFCIEQNTFVAYCGIFNFDEVIMQFKKCIEHFIGRELLFEKIYTITFEDLKQNMLEKHFYMFCYKGRKFHIDGFNEYQLSEIDSWSQSYSSLEELLLCGEIDGSSLRSVWNDIEYCVELI